MTTLRNLRVWCTAPVTGWAIHVPAHVMPVTLLLAMLIYG